MPRAGEQGTKGQKRGTWPFSKREILSTPVPRRRCPTSRGVKAEDTASGEEGEHDKKGRGWANRASTLEENGERLRTGTGFLLGGWECSKFDCNEGCTTLNC